MKRIKDFFSKMDKKKVIIVSLYLGIAFLLQYLTEFMTKSKIPFALIGMLCPFIYSENVTHCLTKNSKKLLLYANIFFRTITFAFGLAFWINAYHKDAFYVNNHTILGIIFLLFTVLCSKRITYSIIGIVAINITAYVGFGDTYKLFAIGFATFFIIEIFRGAKFQLFAPFSKTVFFIDLNKIKLNKRITISFVISLMAMAVVISSMVGEPFYDAYAKTNKTISIKQDNNEFSNQDSETKQKIDKTVNEIKNTTITIKDKVFGKFKR
ncbi:hypothetical protein [Alkaliphilus sp. B6464]|uniref:hypothetical protein n=1 Tax=Alkaliphilus sp. B6464 TaxID=2731219 RepID=UPI001BABB35F|nr:hypothetical protein [Alkaliphilus sp. B6464]QUH22080.1 hypothetical protein HYG84_19430 [Alkaliphilus sp. B6464]